MTSNKRKEKTERMLSSLMGKDVPAISQNRYKLSLIEVLNYHNVFTDSKEIRRAVLGYIKEKNMMDYAPSIDSAHDNDLKQIGVLIMHKNRGDYIAPKELLYIDAKLSEIKRSYVAPVVNIAPTKERRVVDKVLEQARVYASAIDAELDDLFLKKSKGEFSVDTYLKTNNVTEAVCKRIASFYENQIKDLTDLVSGDENMREAYSMTKPHAKRILTFLNGVVETCLQNAANIKAQKIRKPRAKKVKPPQAIVSKLQYLKEFKDLKLKSIEPKDIVGAKQLWVYNTKYKKLTRLVADTADGLTVKGTTVIGFSLADSQSKRLRKPETILADVNKKTLNFHMKKIKTKECEVNGRINKDTILLTV